MSLWKIIIKGETASDVQGVNLRESVDRLAKNFGTVGFVKNEKGKNIVEIVCKFQNPDEAKGFRDHLQKHIPRINPIVEFERIRVEEPVPLNDPAIKEQDLMEFTIRREEDLTEMVWALQNAGKAIIKQEEMRNKARVRALKSEFVTLGLQLNKIESGNPHRELFTTIAIENIIREPPLDCSDVTVAKLHHMYSYIKAINSMIKSGKEKSEMPLDEVHRLIDEIRGELDLNDRDQ